jgi:hypothetical protein
MYTPGFVGWLLIFIFPICESHPHHFDGDGFLFGLQGCD